MCFFFLFQWNSGSLILNIRTNKQCISLVYLLAMWRVRHWLLASYPRSRSLCVMCLSIAALKQLNFLWERCKYLFALMFSWYLEQRVREFIVVCIVCASNVHESYRNSILANDTLIQGYAILVLAVLLLKLSTIHKSE